MGLRVGIAAAHLDFGGGWQGVDVQYARIQPPHCEPAPETVGLSALNKDRPLRGLPGRPVDKVQPLPGVVALAPTETTRAGDNVLVDASGERRAEPAGKPPRGCGGWPANACRVWRAVANGARYLRPQHRAHAPIAAHSKAK